MRKFLAVSLGIVSLSLLPLAAEAGVLTGTLDIAGSVKVTPTSIDWASDGGTTGVVQVQNTSTFANGGVVINTGTATEKDLNLASFPTAGFPPLTLFETLSAAPTINFVLQDIFSCPEVGGGTTCDAGAASPFAFAQGGGGTTVTLVMTGIVFDTTTPTLVSNWTGIFTAQFPGQTIAQLLNQLTTNPGYIDTSFSASKVTVQQSTVPEPATLLTLGIGSGLMALRRRRKGAATQA